MANKKTVLCILDGWGYSEQSAANAVTLARTPCFDDLWQRCPTTLLSASGIDVGLPAGQIGNSEVGHLNLGAGRVVKQTLPRINSAIEAPDDEEPPIAERASFCRFVEKAKSGSGVVHLMGLLSAGGVHAHADHFIEVNRLLKLEGLQTRLHAFTDGRDGPAREIGAQVRGYEKRLRQKLSTLIGRFYAMDRDKRWERTERAYRMLKCQAGEGPSDLVISEDFHASIQAAYRGASASDDVDQGGVGDEFLPGLVAPDYQGFKVGDALLCCNFRADRVRQLMAAFAIPAFSEFAIRDRIIPSVTLSMTPYSEELAPYVDVLFTRQKLEQTLGEVVSQAGLSQIRAAESEKFPHVTYFLNGGREEPFSGERRVLVPSPKVKTYDLKPEMSAFELTSEILEVWQDDRPELSVINFANPDMVGHTGDLKAAIAAVEAVDTCLTKLCQALSSDQTMLVLADHGNCEIMKTPDDKPHTAHTLNPVPCVLVGTDDKVLRSEGRLGDVAPTLLHLMALDQPELMRGQSLIKETH